MKCFGLLSFQQCKDFLDGGVSHLDMTAAAKERQLWSVWASGDAVFQAKYLEYAHLYSI